MTRYPGINEATDERGVTHHVFGYVRFVNLPKKRQRRNPTKRGYYVTRDGCSWWCTRQPIPANTRAVPGKIVDCMACLVDPPERPQPIPFKNTASTGRVDRMVIMNTPSGRVTQIFDIKTHETRSITTGRRISRRR